MMEYIDFLPYVLAFIGGILVKWVDWIDDEEKGRNRIKWPVAILYGIVIGYIIANASFAVLFLAALIAQVFARKVDTNAHILGFTIAVLSLLYFGIQPIDYNFLVFFMVMAFMDEIDIGVLGKYADYRPFLKIGALLMIVFGRLDFLIGILCFDIGYELFRMFKSRNRKKGKAG